MEGILRKLGQVLGCGPKPWPPERTVFVGNRLPKGQEVVVPEKYPSNIIISSKYTSWNFIPKNLFEQFQRIANFYFLFVGCIGIIIDSPVSPLTSLLPLIFVVLVTAIKQFYEDRLRKKADKEVNYRDAHVIRDGKHATIKAMHIQVGDIVKVQMNHGIPCDMVMLSSSDPDGECYITTANLDGETSLKTYYCVPETRYLQRDDTFHDFTATVKCQQPITDLYSFLGKIIIDQPNGSTIEQGLSAENVLLRGSRLRNTPFVYGCAVYTGQDTKISLNSKRKNTKFSRVEGSMNKFLIAFLILLVLESGLLCGLKRWYYSDPEMRAKEMWYTEGEPTIRFIVVLEEFLAFMVLLNYIIPISLYVTVELQKFFGSMFFQWDVELFDAQTNETAKAITSDLNEELGQVEYLFTDKTGTLTENDMQFRQCSVSGVKYVEVGGLLCEKPDIPNVQAVPIPALTTELEMFLTALILCHTVRVDRKDTLGTGTYSELGYDYDYTASSPDEKAFVEACRRYGIVYHGVREDFSEVSFRGHMKRYRVHHILDFDPVRKRMSVLVENEDGEVLVLCKGAETAVIDFVISGDCETVEKHITEYAMLGLRTLVIAQRVLSREEFNQYDTMLKDAKRAIDDRSELAAKAFKEIECKLSLLGATAVEDKLQDGVPETISALREAGIQVWVLTGDKEETAVNISYSAGHFFQGVVELRLTQLHDLEECSSHLTELKSILQHAHDRKELNHALIIDGKSLALLLANFKEQLRNICELVITVLCCRMSPLQKAEVVNLMKTSKHRPTTAAIGDGANDVSMIQEAHVGIGLMGKEGRQAVRSSDYAFGRFKFLRRALLVHGHFYYHRLATLVQYFFYKNVAFITPQLYFAFFSAFSAQTLFETLYLTMFNITFTSLPILILGLFEQPIRPELLYSYPPLYKKIRRNASLSPFQFIKWNLLGLYHSLVFYFGMHFLYYFGETISPGGQHYGVYEFGVMVVTTCVIAVNIKLMLETYHWNGFIVLSYLITFLGYFLLTYLYNMLAWPLVISEFSMLGTFTTIYGNLTVWLAMLLLTVAALLPDIMIRAYRDMTSPVLRQQTRRRERRASTTSVSSLMREDTPLRLHFNNFANYRSLPNLKTVRTATAS